jgi:hypothetical protein
VDLARRAQQPDRSRVILLAAIGVSAFSGRKLPPWWIGLLILGGCYAVLFVEGAFRVSRDAATRKSAEDLARAAILLGTELNAIRHNIELARSRNPPSYSREFRLPAARWDEHDETLADHPELYGKVGKAYTAAYHLNQSLEIRENQSLCAWTFGVIPDDGLDDAYDSAGEALRALGLEPKEPWMSAADRAVRAVTEDVLRDLNEPPS